MIAPPASVPVWLAAGQTDMRKGFDGLATLVQEKLRRDPFGGQVFAFRGRRGDLMKVLWWDGQGLCLFAKRLERGRFVWPSAADGVVSLTPAQLSMLLEGIDWRMPERTWRPEPGGVSPNGNTWRNSAVSRGVKAGSGFPGMPAVGRIRACTPPPFPPTSRRCTRSLPRRRAIWRRPRPAWWRRRSSKSGDNNIGCWIWFILGVLFLWFLNSGR